MRRENSDEQHDHGPMMFRHLSCPVQSHFPNAATGTCDFGLQIHPWMLSHKHVTYPWKLTWTEHEINLRLWLSKNDWLWCPCHKYKGILAFINREIQPCTPSHDSTRLHETQGTLAHGEVRNLHQHSWQSISHHRDSNVSLEPSQGHFWGSWQAGATCHYLTSV